MPLFRLRAAGAAFAFSLLLAGCGDESAPAEKDQKFIAAPAAVSETAPAGKLGTAAEPTHYRLALTIDPEAERFSGRAEIDTTFHESRSTLFLHGKDLTVSEAVAVLADGTRVAAIYEDTDKSGVVKLTFAREVPSGSATLVFAYDAPFNRSLQGLYKVDRGDSYIFSQLEAIDARRVFPSFDEPRFKTPFDVTVVSKAEDRVVSNTPVTSEEAIGDGMKRTIFATTKPLPTYLLAFAVGPLDVVSGPEIPASSIRDRPIPLRGVTTRGNGPRIAYALEETPAIVAILEHYFAAPYPYEKLDIIAAADFSAGAMENAGAIVYRETLMLMDANAPLRQKRRFALVHAHELAHQWFGDLVTPQWWSDIWLNEAFASWMGDKASAEWYPDGEFARETLDGSLAVMDVDALSSARRIREPVTDQNGIYNAFDGITYDKGGAVLAMFETYLGEEKFREGVRLHMKRFAHKTATTEDFMRSLADGSGHPEVVEAFSSFIDQPGVPVLRVLPRCAGGAGGTASVSQSAYAPIGAEAPDRLWRVPACLTALDGKGNRVCRLVSAREQEIKLGPVCSGAVMPNAGGQGYYRFSLDAGGWSDLVAAADKLDAAEQMALARNLTAALRAGEVEAPTFFDAMIRLASTGSWDTVDAVAEDLETLRRQIVTPASRPAYEALLRRVLTPRLEAVGLSPRDGESAADAYLREVAADFLAREARSPALIAALAPGGRTYVETGGRDAGGLTPDLLQTAMWAAVLDGGAAFGGTVVTALKTSTDAQFRRSAIFALTAAADPDFLDEVYELSLSKDLRSNEAVLLLQWMIEEPDRRAPAWAWMTLHWEGLSARFSDLVASRVLRWFRKSCDAGERAALETFFRPKAAHIAGTPRELALTEESIDRCLALRQAKGDDILAALQAAAQ